MYRKIFFRKYKKSRYVVFKKNQILHLAQMIIDAYQNDELILIVIHGKQGYGKSTYASIILAQVLGYLIADEDQEEYEYAWKEVKEYFVFKPRAFLTKSREQTVKAPACIVDDAGLWLNAMDYNHPMVKATGKFLEVARTKWGAIIFTCSDLKQIFTKLRNMPHVYTVRISKYGTGEKHTKDRRMAKVFKGWTSEDLKKSGRKSLSIDIFYAEMPQKFFDWYNPLRSELADAGLDELDLELKKMGL